jgi:hypothetical protein
VTLLTCLLEGQRRANDSELQLGLSVFRAHREATMGFGKGALLWLIGIPLPIILLLALFWR